MRVFPTCVSSKSWNIIHEVGLFQVFFAKLIGCLGYTSKSIACVANLAIVHVNFFGVVIWIKVLALIDNALFTHKFGKIESTILFSKFFVVLLTTSSNWFYHILVENTWSKTLGSISSSGSIVRSVHITTWTEWHHQTLDVGLINSSIFIHFFK